jgi:flagellar protein FlaG
MNGDLSIAPQSATLDLALSARRALSGPVQPNQPPVPVTEPVLVPAIAQHAEAARLKSLLTDPRVQVNMLRDETTGRTVLRVKDVSTGDVVDQIPSEELLRLYATLRESLVDERA